MLPTASLGLFLFNSSGATELEMGKLFPFETIFPYTHVNLHGCDKGTEMRADGASQQAASADPGAVTQPLR